VSFAAAWDLFRVLRVLLLFLSAHSKVDDGGDEPFVLPCCPCIHLDKSFEMHGWMYYTGLARQSISRKALYEAKAGGMNHDAYTSHCTMRVNGTKEATQG
jgi:hypothetical protein